MRIGSGQFLLLIVGILLLSIGGGLIGGRWAIERQEIPSTTSSTELIPDPPGSGAAGTTAAPEISKPTTPTKKALEPAAPAWDKTRSEPILDKEQGSRSEPSLVPGQKYVIQAISTPNRGEASHARHEIMDEGFPAGIFEANLGERGMWYRVYIGPYNDESEAKAILNSVQRIPGFQTSFVRPLD